MKLRLIALLLCLCPLMGCLAACGGGAGNTESSPESVTDTASGTQPEGDTAPDTEALTDVPPETTSAETETETKSETETEAESETETAPAPAPVINEAEVERMNAMLSAYEGNLLPIGGWATPASALRDHNTGVEGSYDKAFQLLADAGLNYMITLEEWSSGSWPLESLSSAHKAGLKLWYNCAGQSADYSMEKINALLSSEYADALGTIYVKDEPTLDQINETANTMNAIRDALGESSTLPVMSNLLPTYASTAMIGDDYRTYVRTYLDAAKPDRLMFDYYPYGGGTTDTIPSMMANIIIAREEAAKDGIELYTFLQTSGHAGLREPNVEELRFNAHLNLAMGVKGFAYFLCCEHYEGWEYTNMITAKGETTPLYDTVKTVSEELSGFKGIFLDYQYKGFIPAEYAALDKLLDRQGCGDDKLDTFGSIKDISTQRKSKAVIGCFEDAEGREAYYVVNAEYTHKNTVTLTLDESQSFVIWTKDGASLVENTDTLTLDLASGDAAFVVKFDVNG